MSGFRSCEEVSVSGGSTLVASSFEQNSEFARLEIFGGRGFLRGCSGSSKSKSKKKRMSVEEVTEIIILIDDFDPSLITILLLLNGARSSSSREAKVQKFRNPDGTRQNNASNNNYFQKPDGTKQTAQITIFTDEYSGKGLLPVVLLQRISPGAHREDCYVRCSYQGVSRCRSLEVSFIFIGGVHSEDSYGYGRVHWRGTSILRSMNGHLQ